MTKRAQLPDGTVLEFPDDTPDSVIDSVVKRQLGVEGERSLAPAPEAGESLGESFQRLSRTPAGLAEAGLGAAEAAASFAKGALFDLPFSGLAGLTELIRTRSADAAASQLESTQKALQFEPRTRFGRALLNKVGEAGAALDTLETDIFAAAPALPFPTGMGAARNPQQRPIPPIVSAGLKALAETAPVGAGFKIKPVALTPKQRIAKAAIDAGYKLPPGDVSPGVVRTSVQGFADSSKVRQAAAFANQDRTNALANRALKRPEDAPLSLEDMKAYRTEQGSRYNAIDNAGTIATDQAFFDALDKAVSEIKRAPDALKRQDSRAIQAIRTADELKTPFFDASQVAPATRLLRELADDAFDAKQASAGRAYRAMSNAYEEAALRHLERFGDPGIVSEFRQARQNIATSYTVQDALEGFNVNAHKIRTKRRQDVPLPPELDLVARVAEEFGKSTRVVTEGPQGLTFIDALVAAGALASGNPLLQAIGVATIAKPGIRGGLLSEPGQSLLASPTATSRPGLLPGLVTTGGLVLDPRLENEPVAQGQTVFR